MRSGASTKCGSWPTRSLFDYHDAIKDLPGATAVRERLVKDGLAYLDSLAGEAGDDPELQRELAAAYERVGDVRGQTFSRESRRPGRGHGELPEGAADPRSAGRSRVHRTCRLAAIWPAAIAGSATRLLETSETARGTEYLRQGLALYLERSPEQPANAESATTSRPRTTISDWRWKSWGDAAGALENHRKALALREALVAADPDNPTTGAILSVTHMNLGRALVLSGDIEAGLESNQKALAICEALLAENPSNADYRRLLAISYQNDGDYRAILHDTGGALESFRKKLALDEQSLADDPRQCQSPAGTLGTLAKDSATCWRTGRVTRRRSRTTARRWPCTRSLSAIRRQDLYPRYRVIMTRAGIGEMQAKLGERAAALAESSRAIALLDEMAEDPTSGPQSSLRGQVYMRVAAAYAALGASANAGRSGAAGALARGARTCMSEAWRLAGHAEARHPDRRGRRKAAGSRSRDRALRRRHPPTGGLNPTCKKARAVVPVVARRVKQR